MIFTRNALCVTAAAGSLLLAQSAFAGAHTWDVHEVFSAGGGAIQFIELREMGGGAGETFLAGLQVKSLSTGNFFTFPANLVGPTSNRHILLATAAFAALPGAPTPDHIIPANFFNPNGDTVSYHTYDSWAFGAVPTNCVNSLNRIGGVAFNSATNYASQTGLVDACCPADVAPNGGDGSTGIADLLFIIANWGAGANNLADVNNDNTVNVTDLLFVIGGWGPCT